MGTATLHLIYFLVATALYCVLYILYHYNRYHKGKNYEFLNNAGRFFWGFSIIFAAWFLLDVFKDGQDSPLGWWFLCFFAGWVICSAIKELLEFICMKIRPKNPDSLMYEETVRTPEWLKIAGHAIMLLFCVLLVIAFLAGLIMGFKEFATWPRIGFVFCILLFSWGAVYEVRKLIRILRK